MRAAELDRRKRTPAAEVRACAKAEEPATWIKGEDNRKIVNDMYEEVRRRLGKTGKYEVGEVLVCKLYKKMGKQRLNVNLRYIIRDVNNGIFD